MKLVVKLIIILLVNQVYCTDFDSDASKPSYEQLERKNLQLLVENSQLRKANGDLSVESVNCKLSLYEIREKTNKLAEEHEASFMNCSALTSEAEHLAQNLKTLSDDVKHFNSFIDKKVDEYVTKYGRKNSANNEIISECDSKNLNALKFVDQALCEKVCDVKKSNGEWTVIQRRFDGNTNFFRDWREYKAGFGSIAGEFFIGLDNLHLLTNCAPQELLIELEDFDNEKRYAKYDLFQIGDEREKYAMKELGKYEGDAGDSLRWQHLMQFSTFDQDNDPSPRNCAVSCKGGWWYNSCHFSNLNGEYRNNEWLKGINWYHFRGLEHSLKKAQMKIRPKIF